MKKIISLVVIACVLLAATNANAQKIGYIRIDDLVSLMPEAAKIDTQLQVYQRDSLNQTLNNIVQEYQYKDSMLTKVDTSKTPKQVLNQLRTDVNVLAYQIQNWQSLAGQAYENKQQQLLAPLYNKAITAVRTVAKEKGYAYVVSKDAFLVAPDGDDLLPAVASKLGVKIPAGMTSPQQRPPAGKPNQ
jgi:outer membrane protein